MRIRNTYINSLHYVRYSLRMITSYNQRNPAITNYLYGYTESIVFQGTDINGVRLTLMEYNQPERWSLSSITPCFWPGPYYRDETRLSLKDFADLSHHNRPNVVFYKNVPKEKALTLELSTGLDHFSKYFGKGQVILFDRPIISQSYTTLKKWGFIKVGYMIKIVTSHYILLQIYTNTRNAKVIHQIQDTIDSLKKTGIPLYIAY